MIAGLLVLFSLHMTVRTVIHEYQLAAPEWAVVRVVVEVAAYCAAVGVSAWVVPRRRAC